MSEIVFLIEEDPEGGYTAAALGHSIITDADSIDLLKTNIRDAVACHFHGEPQQPIAIRLHYVHDEVIAP